MSFSDAKLKANFLSKTALESNPFFGNYKPDSTGTGAGNNQNDATKTRVSNFKRRPSFRGEGGVSSDASGAFYMSYPIARTPSESTGDTLLIKCIEYQPPESGMGVGVKTKGVFGEIETTDATGKKTTVKRVVTKEERNQKTIDGMKNPFYKVNPSLEVDFTSGHQRMTEKQKIKFYIELPAPQEINDSQSVTWGEDTINALELAGLSIAQGVMGEGGGIQQARDALALFNQNADFGNLPGDISRIVRASISGAAIGALGSNVSAQSIIGRSTGQILNSNTELLFQGVNLRSFPFNVTFTPRDPAEMRVVKQIIRSLKQAMSPQTNDFNGSSATGMFLKAPHVFSLRYMHHKDGKKVDHPFLNSFKICALTGMSVNYTNAGTYATYSDGTPVAMRVSMTFKEINPIYNEDYATKEGSIGVGY